MKWVRQHLLELGLIGSGLLAGYLWASRAEAATTPAPSTAAAPAASGGEASAPRAVPDARPARPGAESAELGQLLRDEEQLFPSQTDPNAAKNWQPSLFSQDSACGEGSSDGRPCVVSDGKDWLGALKMPDLPVRADEDVRRYVRYFSETNHGRKIFKTWLKRSGKYRVAVTEALRERQLPQDLHALVFVESGYSPAAVSSANAVGLWQFIPPTGKAYGLSIDADYDERRSIRKSSEAGAHHLADLYERFGSWDLAFAAYNMGYQGLVNRMRELGTQDFWELAQTPGALPRETALYVPKILAVALILRNLDRFGFDDVRADSPMSVADLEVPARTSLAIVARAAGTSLQRIHELNPELLRATVPAKDKLVVHIPAAGLARARVMLPQLIDPLERDDLEKRVAPTFDWGRDELPKHNALRPIWSEDRPDEKSSESRDAREGRDSRDDKDSPRPAHSAVKRASKGKN